MTKESYKYFPQSKEELQDIIKQRIKDEGNKADLNDIDVSKITDMSKLFMNMENFNANISEWDVSNVTDMLFMFLRCESFNQDLSKWDVSNVKYMTLMFYGCKSFNQDISMWNVSNVTNMTSMFFGCQSFNQDLSEWNVLNVTDASNIFNNCPIKEEYKPKFKQITMTKEQAKHLAEVLNAYAEGKTIEVFLDWEWGEVPSDGYSFDVEKESYRIKKEPTYRPFKNAKECFNEMKKHQPFGWLKAKDIEQYYSITTVYNVENYNRYYNLFSNCTFVDGQPFGVKK